MGKPKGDGGRSKTRPSSSSLAASLLPSGVSTVGFGGYLGNSRVESSSPADDSLPFSDVDSEMAQHLKRLGRKDPTTKLKALTSLAVLFKQKSSEEIVQIVPQWTFEYRKLLHDYNREVRQATHVTMTSLVNAIRRGLAPHLKSLMGPWWYSQFDPIPEVSQSARRSLEAAFPAQERRLDALMFCVNEIFLYLDENLKLTPQSMVDKAIPADELEDMHQRAISSSLLAVATLVDILLGTKMQNCDNESSLPEQKLVSKARTATIYSAENMLATHKCFLQYMKSKYPIVRTATYSILTSFVKHIPHAFNEEYMKVLSSAILGAFQDKDASCHSSMWDMILLFSRKFPNGWSYCNVQKVFLHRFWQFLRNGCYGSQQISYPVLVLFLDSVPTDVDLGEQFIYDFFQNLWDGRHSSHYSAANTLALFGAFKECFLWVLRNVSRYFTARDGNNDPAIKLTNDILVELLLNDYLMLPSLKKQDGNLLVRSDVSTDDGKENSKQRTSSSYEASYIQELVRCIVGILVDISLEDRNLLNVFSTSFQKDCLEILWQGECLQNFHEHVERITRFFLLLDELVLQKGHDWPLKFLGQPLIMTTFPVIKSMDSPDAVKLLSVLIEIFGSVVILSNFVNPKDEVRVEVNVEHFLQTFNSDLIPWCLQGNSNSSSLKLDLLLDLIQDECFSKQWCSIINHSIKQYEMSDNSSHIEVLAMLIEKVRERIRTKTLVNLQRSGFFPERWRHNLLDSVAITIAHHSPVRSCHAQFLCAVLGGSVEDDQVCFLSEEACTIVWEEILKNLASFLTSFSFCWAEFACSLFQCSESKDLLKLQEPSFSMRFAMARFAFEVLKGSIYCLNIIDKNCSLVSSILAALFIVDWQYSITSQVCQDDSSEGSKNTTDIDVSVCATQNVISNDSKEQDDAMLNLGRKIHALRHTISSSFWKSLSADTRSRLGNIIVQTVRFVLLDTDDLVAPEISHSCCEWMLDILEIICHNKEELQILLDQLLSEGKSWPLWVKPFIRRGSILATFQEATSTGINEHSNYRFVAFVDKLIARLGVNIVIAGFTETCTSVASPDTEIVSSFPSPYKREWLAAEMLCSWDWKESSVTESFLPLLNKYAKTEASIPEANVTSSIINMLLDGTIMHGVSYDQWISFDSWKVPHNEAEKINDPFLRGLVSMLSSMFVDEKVGGNFAAIALFEQLVDRLFMDTSIDQSCLRVLPFVTSITIQSLLESSESTDAIANISLSSTEDNLVRTYIISWLEKSLSFPSLCLGKTEQNVGEWIQVVISCFPLRTTLETGNSIVDLLRHASNNESSLLLSLFRKHLYCYDASAAIDQISPISSSSGDLVSSLLVQIHHAKLTAVSVGYCWQEFVEDDWNYVLDKSHRWIELSVLLMEEIAESIDDAIVHYTTTDDLEHTAKKLELSVQAYDSLIISISTTALVIFRLVSQLEEHKTDSTNALHLLRLGKWADMKDRIMASILRLFFATGATEAIAMSCNEVFSTIVASSRLPYSYFWGLVASFVSNSPKHVKSAAAESMELWGLSKGSINALYAILFSSRPISYLQFAAYSLLSSEPMCHLSLAKESSLEGEGNLFVESDLSSNVELSTEGIFSFRDELSSLIQKPSAELLKTDLLSQDRVNLFIAWALLLSCLNSFPSSSKAREKIVQHIQDSISPMILDCIFQHIPLKIGASNLKKKELELVVEASKAANAAKHSITTCSLTLYVQSLWPVGNETVASLAGSIYGMMIHRLPSYVRNWFSSLRDRSLLTVIESFTKAWCSPPLLLNEFSQVKETVFADENFSVSVNRSASEIIATYKKEETGMDLVIRLPSSYPLRPVDVECTRSLGISEVRQRKWLLSLTAFIRNQNGAIAEAILIWKSDFDKEFLGVEECPICYSIIHTTNHSLPRLACKTCKHKFHSACLYKWFSTSHKSTCPLCQSPF
ncbi:E3 ubiquitin-protein ligase listerin isoform X1 [Musa acuminata AAA Group]|uniref:E3 ubiquitin-protein ligase listerin isoform X1 n=3 Tax=Musa acuminata AAA Group TaxID=214697 RepID=UPI0031DCD031